MKSKLQDQLLRPNTKLSQKRKTPEGVTRGVPPWYALRTQTHMDLIGASNDYVARSETYAQRKSQTYNFYDLGLNGLRQWLISQISTFLSLLNHKIETFRPLHG